MEDLFWELNKKIKEEIHGFRETVENNALWLDDAFFVRLKSDVKETVSELQHETDPNSYKEKWEKKMGEIVYIYDSFKHNYESVKYVLWDKLSRYNKTNCDLRFVEKDSLIRTAARKLALYLYEGKGHTNDFGVDSAIAFMLYVRNGYNKNDFWNDLRNELVKSLEELLGGKESLEIEDLILSNPFPQKRNNILELVEAAEKHSEEYTDEFFYVMDSEIAEAFRQRKIYTYELDSAMGQYVIVYSWRRKDKICYAKRTKDDILLVNYDEIIYNSMELSLEFATDSIRHMFFSKECDDDMVLFLGQGIAIYKKNGHSAAEFRRDLCRYYIDHIKD